MSKPTDEAMYKALKWCGCGGHDLPLEEDWDFFNYLHHAGKKGVYENFLREISLDQYEKFKAVKQWCNKIFRFGFKRPIRLTRQDWRKLKELLK